MEGSFPALEEVDPPTMFSKTVSIWTTVPSRFLQSTIMASLLSNSASMTRVMLGGRTRQITLSQSATPQVLHVRTNMASTPFGFVKYSNNACCIDVGSGTKSAFAGSWWTCSPQAVVAHVNYYNLLIHWRMMLWEMNHTSYAWEQHHTGIHYNAVSVSLHATKFGT